MADDIVVDSLLGKLSEDIEIIVGTETVSVGYKDRFEHLKPEVHISKDETNSTVIAIGPQARQVPIPATVSNKVLL